MFFQYLSNFMSLMYYGRQIRISLLLLQIGFRFYDSIKFGRKNLFVSQNIGPNQ